MRPLRRRLQIVFQDPHASLNPAMTIGAAIGDPLRFHGIASGKAEREQLVAEALERVGLAPASQFADKYPTDLSGGQKQRAVLARAIILGPDILVADEPVSMLDMSVRAKILELMIELKSRARPHLRLHHPRPRDREVLLRPDRDHVPGPDRRDRAGREDLRRPQASLHPVAAARDPRARPDAAPCRATCLAARSPTPSRRRSGARFHPRCPRAFEVCGWESRDLRDCARAPLDADRPSSSTRASGS